MEAKMRRAIVTGASGFIGYHVVKELLAHNYEVLAVAHSPAGCEKLKQLNNQNICVISCDILDSTELFKVTDGPYDIFFHLAWEGVSGEKGKDCSVQIRNIQGAILAVKVAKQLRSKRFLGAGSLQEIECIKELETSGPTYNMGINYKIAKLAAHYYCKLESAQQKIDFLWPRLTNTYGEGEISARLVNSTIRKLLAGESPKLTEATQLYNFIYITDAARAYRLIGEKGCSYKNYILGSEEVCPLRDYLLKIQAIVNPNVEMGFGQHLYHGIYLDKTDLHSDAFFSDTGFKTEISFCEGIRLTMEYLKSCG